LPGEQSEQVVEEIEEVKRPTGQLVHDDWPRMAENRPEEHGEQNEFPSSADALPKGHDSQRREEEGELNLPTGQRSQNWLIGVVEMEPLEQFKQVEDPIDFSDLVPLGQSKHEESPTEEANFPSGQSSHSGALDMSENEPAEQTSQFAEYEEYTEPIGQGV
jgi:hypothetical protein